MLRRVQAPSIMLLTPLAVAPLDPVALWVVGAVVTAGTVALLLRRAIQRREALGACRFAVAEVGLRPTGLTTATLRLVFRVTNPGPLPAVMDALDYRVALGERPVTHGAVLEPLVVAPGQSGLVPVTVSLDAVTLGAALLGALLDRERRVRITGAAHLKVLGSWHLHLPLDEELRLGARAPTGGGDQG